MKTVPSRAVILSIDDGSAGHGLAKEAGLYLRTGIDAGQSKQARFQLVRACQRQGFIAAINQKYAW